MLSPPPNDPPQPAICFTMLDLCLPKAFHEIDVHVSHVEEANAMIQEAVWN